MTDLAKKTATVHTFMVCERSGAFNVLEKPIKFINIEFDGVATILMSYLLVGEPQIGMRVVPIFSTTTRPTPSWTCPGSPRAPRPSHCLRASGF